jgi:uncharacterized protein (TIGR01777 family)
MKVIVTGATGFVGRALVQALLERGDHVVALTRSAARAQETLGPKVESLEWHPPDVGTWVRAFNGANGVVNLAAEPMETKSWSDERKKELLASRLDAARAVIEAIRQANPRPSVMVQASAAGYYGSQGDTVLTESSPPGSGFLAEVAQQWEAAAKPVEQLGVRLVIIRTGLVLGQGGGALPPMVKPFRMFTGGVIGKRGQWVPWIHLEDEVGLILYALTHDNVQGPLNASAPNPVTMEVFSRQIGQAVGRPCWFPLSMMLQMALRERTELVFSSWRAVPAAAQAAGYQFRHTQSDEALRSVLAGG